MTCFTDRNGGSGAGEQRLRGGLEFSVVSPGCCVPAPVWSQSDLGNSIGNPNSNPGGWRDTQYLGRGRGSSPRVQSDWSRGGRVALRRWAGLPLGGNGWGLR